MIMDEKVRYWIDIAEYDLETAKAMLESRRFLYVGFMCHQTIEKALKAYYQLIHEDMPPKKHNLFLLLEEIDLLSKLDEAQLKFLDMLNPLNIQARYPEYRDKIIKTLSRERAADIIVQTEELLSWIKSELMKRQELM